MKTHVRKWGNSLALRIPKSVAAEAGLRPDAAVDLSIVKGKVVIEPLSEEPLTLEELVARITPENVHEETDWGPPVGREVW